MRFGRDAHGIAMGRALPSQRLKADQGDHNQLLNGNSALSQLHRIVGANGAVS
jgi:hypothetical protein